MATQLIYEGLIAPHWNEIDKIYIGAAACTINAAASPVLLGRYILVKYTTHIYTQDQKTKMMTSGGIGLSGNELLWYNCYQADTESAYGQDCDGVVFKKVVKDNKVYFEPIAQLSTSYTISNVLERLGPSFVNSTSLTVEQYVQQEVIKASGGVTVDLTAIHEELERLAEENNQQQNTILTHGTTLQELDNKYSSLDEEISTLDEQIALKLNAQVADIENLKRTNNDQQSEISQLQQNVDSNAEEIQKIISPTSGILAKSEEYTNQTTQKLKEELLGEGITEAYDTLVEIEEWINTSGITTKDLTQAIAEEAAARAAADTSEATIREAADNALQLAIDANTQNIASNTSTLGEHGAALTTLNNANIELEKDVNSLQGKTEECISDIENIEKDLASLEPKITEALELKSQVVNNTQSITNHTEQITNLTKVTAQHTQDISNLSKIGIVDVTALPNVEDAGISIFYRLALGDRSELWYVETSSTGDRSWKYIGAAGTASLCWKEF